MQVSTTWGEMAVSGTVARNPYYSMPRHHEDYCPDEEPYIVRVLSIRDEDGEPLSASEVSDFVLSELETALIEAWQEMQYEPDPCFHYA